MKSHILGLRVAGVIFALVGLLHLLRLVLQVEVLIGGYEMPMWMSGVGFVVPLMLSVWFLKISNVKQG